MNKSDALIGRYEYNGLDRVMHEKARLSIMTSLFVQSKGIDFTALKSLCGLSDGNLSRHLQVLKTHGLITIIKDYKNNKPYTLCILTTDGREKFAKYMRELEKVIKDAKLAEKQIDNYNVLLKPVRS